MSNRWLSERAEMAVLCFALSLAVVWNRSCCRWRAAGSVLLSKPYTHTAVTGGEQSSILLCQSVNSGSFLYNGDIKQMWWSSGSFTCYCMCFVFPIMQQVAEGGANQGTIGGTWAYKSLLSLSLCELLCLLHVFVCFMVLNSILYLPCHALVTTSHCIFSYFVFHCAFVAINYWFILCSVLLSSVVVLEPSWDTIKHTHTQIYKSVCVCVCETYMTRCNISCVSEKAVNPLLFNKEMPTHYFYLLYTPTEHNAARSKHQVCFNV